MPRYYCDYCDTYLTHDSPSVRKQHNAGYKHKANVRSYYQQFEEQQTQSLIDQRVKEHIQVGAAYNQHLLGQRPRLPVLPTPMMHMQGIMRPPVLPRPMPLPPGYLPMPPPMMAPPGAPGQINGVSRPPPLALPPTSVPGSGPSSTMVPSATYQASPAPPSSGGFDSYSNAPPASEAIH
ncbi:U1 small nuclear ribonucleoprotein C [Euphorbia peplus]|nr:U1 small nuclear ribonucleoprotein C [Euphorbia peplus]